MLAYARKNPNVSAQIDLLCTIKGIGEASAAEILAELARVPASGPHGAATGSAGRA